MSSLDRLSSCFHKNPEEAQQKRIFAGSKPLGIVNDTHNNQTENRTKYGRRLIEEELYLEIIWRPDYLEEKHTNISLIATQCEVELLLIVKLFI